MNNRGKSKFSFIYYGRVFLCDGRLTERKRGFPARVTKGGKITIPHEIRKLLGIKKGDMVDILEIHKIELRKEN